MMMPLRAAQFGGRRLAGPHFGVHAQIANLTGDQMAILPARIQHCDLWSRARACGTESVPSLWFSSPRCAACAER